MAGTLADTQAIAVAVRRQPPTIRSWAHRYPADLPRRGTGPRGRAMYDLRDAETLATRMPPPPEPAPALTTPVTWCNTQGHLRSACPDPGPVP